jgi:hypothetical protein
MAARKPGLEHIKGTIGIRGHDAQERIGQLRRALASERWRCFTGGHL